MAEMGLDPNVWFYNAEIAAAKIIGRETVQYVANIYKYYVAYKLVREREEQKKVESDKAAQLMKKELEWLRTMPKARTGKSKARIDAFDGIRDRARMTPDPGELMTESMA